ncbi:MAG: hypothetical protein MMC33_004819 [Icmadophila ericetorum]|nr:hypothetical protein [Icmadophila ericetorum]
MADHIDRPHSHSQMETIDQDPAVSALQLLKHDTSAIAPQYDPDTSALEVIPNRGLDFPGLEIAETTGPEVLYPGLKALPSQTPLVSVESHHEKLSKAHSCKDSFLRRKSCAFITIACMILMAIVIGVAVGVMQHQRTSTESAILPSSTNIQSSTPTQTQPRSSSTQTPLIIPPARSQFSVVDDSAVAIFQDQSLNKFYFFQEQNGDLRCAIYQASEQTWSAANSTSFLAMGDTSGLDTDAYVPRNHTPLSILTYVGNTTENGISFQGFMVCALDLMNVLDSTSRTLTVGLVPNPNAVEVCLFYVNPSSVVKTACGEIGGFDFSQPSWNWCNITDDLNSSLGTNGTASPPLSVANINQTDQGLPNFMLSFVDPSNPKQNISIIDLDLPGPALRTFSYRNMTFSNGSELLGLDPVYKEPPQITALPLNSSLVASLPDADIATVALIYDNKISVLHYSVLDNRFHDHDDPNGTLYAPGVYFPYARLALLVSSTETTTQFFFYH